MHLRWPNRLRSEPRHAGRRSVAVRPKQNETFECEQVKTRERPFRTTLLPSSASTIQFERARCYVRAGERHGACINHQILFGLFSQAVLA